MTDKMEIEDGIRKEKWLEDKAAADVEFRKELLRRRGPDPYIQYWLEESETKRRYHEQVGKWLQQLKDIRREPWKLLDEEPWQLIDEDSTIMGYRVRDLIITAERIRKEGVDAWKLRNSTKDFMAGYERARNELDEAMARQLQEIMMPERREKDGENS